MTTHVLITHHHRDALENAAARGFWMPLPLIQPDARHLLYLTALSNGDKAIRALLEISSFEPWRSTDGQETWLPFTDSCCNCLARCHLVRKGCWPVGCRGSGTLCRLCHSMRCWRLSD